MNEWINERTDVCINNWTLWKANQSNLLQLICDILQTYRIPARGPPPSVSPSQMYYYGSKLVLISSLVAHQTSGQITFGLRLEPRHNKSIINVFFPFFPFFSEGELEDKEEGSCYWYVLILQKLLRSVNYWQTLIKLLKYERNYQRQTR